MKLRPCLTAILILVLALGACTPANSTTPVQTPTPTSTPAPTGTTPPPTPSPSGQPALSPTPGFTFGQLTEIGTTLFTTRCARCHGMNGVGGNAPALIGANAQLNKYKTAQGLLNYVSATMPGNAPGTLTAQEYQQLLSYLMVQNSIVKSETQFNSGQLETIPLP